MKKVQLVEEELKLLEDVIKNSKDKVVENLICYELDEPSLDRFLLTCPNLKKWERIELIEFLTTNIKVFA